MDLSSQYIQSPVCILYIQTPSSHRGTKKRFLETWFVSHLATQLSYTHGQRAHQRGSWGNGEFTKVWAELRGQSRMLRSLGINHSGKAEEIKRKKNWPSIIIECLRLHVAGPPVKDEDFSVSQWFCLHHATQPASSFVFFKWIDPFYLH